MMNPEVVFVALGPLGLILVAGLLWWFLSWARQRHPLAANRSRPMATLVYGCQILLAGIVGIVLVISLIFVPVVGVVACVVLAAALVRYRRSEAQYLVWCLADAAQRGIPLEHVARAFAQERHGPLAERARNLADYLDAAMPLSLALARSRLSLSPDVRLAADVGERTGTLCPSLKRAVRQMDEFEQVLGATLIRFFYLTWILGVMAFILTFLMLKIVPTFMELFQDFDIRLPAVTQVVIGVSAGIVNHWYLCMPLFALFACGGFLALLSYLGISCRGVPIVGRIFATVDNASVLRMLAVAVKEKRPLVGSLELLAAYAPYSPARSRLHKAIYQITNGAHWCDALQGARFVTRAQATVFRSAECAGNLAWALEEMADGAIRRVSHRVQAALNILFPAMILVCGMGVMFVAAGVLLPLFSLISMLT